MNFTADQVATATGGKLISSASVCGPVQTDTRALTVGAWFVAIVGDRFDGHSFIAQAAQSGAEGVIVSRQVEFDGAVVLVEDTTRALQALGQAARARLVCPVVGVTGSSGKTTTRALIACAAAHSQRVHQTVGNLNNHFGVPMTLLAAPEDATLCVVELGTSSPGEIQVLTDITTPDVRLITNVGPAHLEELGGLDGVAKEKGSLFASARPGDVCVVNLDDRRLASMEVPEGAHRVTFGTRSASDVRVLATRVDNNLVTHARLVTPAGEFLASIPAPGDHIALDGAGAVAVAWALGLDLHAAVAGLSSYEPVGMRMRREVLASGVVALNDAYNANPDSMRASLEVLADLPPRRIAVMGDMLELGPDEAEFHAEVVGFADAMGLDLIVLVGRRMCNAAIEAIRTPVWTHADVEEAGIQLADWLESGDHVLFKGSRGARVERILQHLRGEG
jgi:UDP-N-acetylmuramoyl-tripeptide--D-alanyl-D-alanine ligase